MNKSNDVWKGPAVTALDAQGGPESTRTEPTVSSAAYAPSPPSGGRIALSTTESGGGEVAAQLARSAEGLVNSQVSKQAGKGATDLGEVASALRKTSEGMENNMIAPYVVKAADQVERASHYLRNANLRDVARTVEDFAKREPALFLGGAFALGLMGSRFLNSSPEHRRAQEAARDADAMKSHNGVKGTPPNHQAKESV
jgi:hypothetical protein